MLEKLFLIEISPSIPSLGKSIVMPRSGILTIASILAEKSNYDVTFLFEPYVGAININKIALANPRYILLNGLTTTSAENKVIASMLRKQLKEPFDIIVGGEHATMFPENVKPYADYLLLHEGDNTILSLLSALEEDDQLKRERKISNIPGIIYKDSSGCWRQNTEIQRVKEIDYRYDFSVIPAARNAVGRFPLTQIPLQTSRGCKFNCSFCSWISLFGKAGYYVRPITDVIHDIKHAMEYTGITKFMVVDNLFGANQSHTEELLKRIVSTFKYQSIKPEFTVLCRADQFVGHGHTFSNRFLRLMREAGITNISLGLESVNNDTLDLMNKRNDTSLYSQAAYRLHQHDFKIAATFVAGFGYDTYRDVINIGHFAKSIRCFTIQVYCYSITPGTLDARKSFYLRIPGIPERFLNGHSVTTFPRRMLPSVLQKAIFEAATIFYQVKAPEKRLIGHVYRQIWKGMQPYYEALKRIEIEILLPEELYFVGGTNEHILNEQKLQLLTQDSEKYPKFIRNIEDIFDPIRHPEAPQMRS